MRAAPHLLIVDDEPSVLLTLGMIFEQDGYRVTRAGSCAEALHELANGHMFDAIITDLNMEKPDIGLDVARAALRLHPRPAVVICTGYADIKNARAALQLRVDYFATKPVDLDELKLVVGRLSHRDTRLEEKAS